MKGRGGKEARADFSTTRDEEALKEERDSFWRLREVSSVFAVTGGTKGTRKMTSNPAVTP